MFFLYRYGERAGRTTSAPSSAPTAAPMATTTCSLHQYMYGKRDSIHHHLLEVMSETATVLETTKNTSIRNPLLVVVGV